MGGRVGDGERVCMREMSYPSTKKSSVARGNITSSFV